MSFAHLKLLKTNLQGDITLVSKISFSYRQTIRDLIFLPFQKLIEYVHIFLLFATIHINLFKVCFRPIFSNPTEIIFGIFETGYILHTILLIFHRSMRKHRQRRMHRPHNVILIVIDVISIIPLMHCYNYLQYFKWEPTENITFRTCAYSLKLIRIIRIFAKCWENYNCTRIDRALSIFIYHFIVSTIISHMLTGANYLFICSFCGTDRLRDIAPYLILDDNRVANWFTVLYEYFYMTMLHWYLRTVPLYDEGTYSAIICVLCLVIGVGLRYAFLMGTLIAIYIQRLRYMFTYKRELIWTHLLLKQLRADQQLIDKVDMYYQIIWNEYYGVIKSPGLVGMLPTALNRDLTTDIYWNAIMHTHLFANLDLSIRREICSIMYTEICMPGEFIHKRGFLKSKMIYIVSGIIELLANENPVPIMSFGAGTVLGVVSCIMPTISNGTFVCRTTCHLHVLSFMDICKLYKKKPQLLKIFHTEIGERQRLAKIKKLFLTTATSDHKKSHIGWIKQQWHALASSDKHPNTEDLYNGNYSYQFLDLLVLSVGKEGRKDIVCLRHKCPLILQRGSSFRQFLQYLNLTVIILQFVTTAKMIGFDQKIDPAWYPVLLVFDLFYFLDIYVQLFTIPKNFTSTKPIDVMAHRMRQILFSIDIIATIPYDYVANVFNVSDSIGAYLRTPRFLKLYKVLNFFMRMEEKVKLQNLYITILLKFICIHGVLITVFSTFAYIIACPANKCIPSWLINFEEFVKSVATLRNTAYSFNHYLNTFSHVSSVYLDLKISPRSSVTIVEIIYFSIVGAIGYYIFLLGFAQLTSVVYLIREFIHNFLLNMDVLNEITDHQDLLHLKSNVIHYGTVQWHLYKNRTLKDIYTIMNHECSYLKDLILEEYIMKTFRNTAVFEGCDLRFLKCLALNSMVLVIPEGQLVFDSSYQVFYLYILVEGSCTYKSLLPPDRGKPNGLIRKGECFPVITVLHELDSLIEVRAETTVILLCIPFLVMKQLLNAFPHEGDIFKKTCEIHRKENYTLLPHAKRGSVHSRTDIVKETVPVFRYKISKENQRISYTYGLYKINRIVRHIMFTTMDPNSRGFLNYEIFRCVTVVLVNLIHLFIIKTAIYQCFLDQCYYINAFLGIFGFIDIIIRTHLQYYNENGLKVTKYSKTYAHYMNTAFAVDLVASFPFQTVGIIGLFYRNPMRAYIFIYLFARSLALYRPIMLFLHLKSLVNSKYHFLYDSVGRVLIGLFVMLSASLIFLTLTCDTRNGGFDLDKDSFINAWEELDDTKKEYLFLIIYQIVTSVTITRTYMTFNNYDELKLFILALIIYFVKLVYLSFVVGTQSHGSVRFALYQDASKHYSAFTKNKIISNADKNEMIEHFSNYWKKSNGVDATLIFKNFSPYMKEEIFITLHKRALRKCFLFHDIEKSFFRMLVMHFHEKHYKKDADIIRVNDIEDTIFIIAYGHVNIYIADIYIATLRIGGMFGCFNRSKSVRMTIRVVASVHAKVLCLKTEDLYNLASIYKSTQKRLHNLNAAFLEYVKEVSKHNFREEDARSMSKSMKMKKHIGWFFLMCHERNILYKIWNYVTNVHIASLTSTYCLYVMVTHQEIKFLWFWILMDIYFLSNFYIRSHCAYIDPESGVSINYFVDVAKRYTKSLRFYVDIISIIPFYILAYIVNVTSKIFLANKLIRVLNLYIYYNSFVQKKDVPRHLRWVFLFYNVMFTLQILYDIWYMVADVDPSKKILACYLRIISVYAKGGLEEPEFKNVTQMLINLIIIFVAHVLLIYTMVVITRLIVEYFYAATHFEIDMHIFLKYCKNERVSKPLVERIKTYAMHMHKHFNGKQEPIWFYMAPSYIMENHKTAFYGRIISVHQPFNRTHIDFLRQLYKHVHCAIYLPGDMIVELGDVTNTMYFVEYGEVIAIEEIVTNLTYTTQTEGTFGVMQGLCDLPYSKTYKARTVCSILSLCKEHWAYLLPFFPASLEVVNEYIDDNMPSESRGSLSLASYSSIFNEQYQSLGSITS